MRILLESNGFNHLIGLSCRLPFVCAEYGIPYFLCCTTSGFIYL
jgi:hypothetical protein